jgi:hypothetical protein
LISLAQTFGMPQRNYFLATSLSLFCAAFEMSFQGCLGELNERVKRKSFGFQAQGFDDSLN